MKVANPGDRPALRPSRIAISALRRFLRLVKQPLQIADSVDLGEVGVVQVDLIAVFQSAHQLDAIHGTQIEVAFQLGVRSERAEPNSRPVMRCDQVSQCALRSRAAPPSPEAKCCCTACWMTAVLGFCVGVRGKSCSGQTSQRRICW